MCLTWIRFSSNDETYTQSITLSNSSAIYGFRVRFTIREDLQVGASYTFDLRAKTATVPLHTTIDYIATQDSYYGNVQWVYTSPHISQHNDELNIEI